MEEELNVRSAEEKAIKEAEYIAASESIKLIQELSLRLEVSEPSSKHSSRSPSLASIKNNAGNEEKPEDLSDKAPVEEGSAKEEEQGEGANDEQGEGADDEQGEGANDEQGEGANDEQGEGANDEQGEGAKEEDELASQASSNTQEPIIETREDGDGSQIIKQESKLILSEFKDDSVSFKEEQQETNEHSNDSEIVVLEESAEQHLDQSEDSEAEIQLVENKEPLEVEGCTHKLRGISDSTRSGISSMIEFQMSLFDNCKTNARSMNTRLKESSWNYFDSLHSKLIKFAGFHNPDECSICKDFKHQDVPLLN